MAKNLLIGVKRMSLLNLTDSVKEVCFDYETVELLPDGSTAASTEAYRPNFRVLSAAFSWFDGDEIRSEFVRGEDRVRLALLECGSRPLIVHNYQFEYMVTLCRYPDLTLNIAYDTMRLAQVYDNGGDKNAFEVVIDERAVIEYGETPEVKKIPTAGLGLVKCAYRILGETSSHKEEAHSWIHENVPGSRGKEGQFLDRLPDDILRRYNVADTEVTLRLYKHTTEFFTSIGYDWSLDHQLYKSTAEFVSKAKIRGVPVDRDMATKNRDILAAEVRAIEDAFLTRYSAEISKVEADRLADYVAGVKTEKGKAKRLAKFHAGDPKAAKEVKFNTGSNAQLTRLFMQKMGMIPKFFTKKGAPAMRSSMLNQWGEPGLMLQKRRKRLIIKKQLDSLLAVSEYDGRFHIDLKACGTATGRLAGGQYA